MNDKALDGDALVAAQSLLCCAPKVDCHQGPTSSFGMYQFNGGLRGNYQPHQPHQHHQSGSLSNSQYPPTQANQAYGPSQNPPVQQQMYQMPIQTAPPPTPQHPNFSSAHQIQAQNYQSYYGANQQHVTAGGGSFSGSHQHMSQQNGGHGPIPVAMMHHQTAPFGPQPTPPNMSFSRAPQQQVSQGPPQPPPSKSSESCYNCGAPDHWAQDCPEPRRSVPAGQANRPMKRQKTHGGTMTTNNHQTQQAPNLQRGWSDPVAVQQTFSMQGNGASPQIGTPNQQRPWVHQQYQKPRMNSTPSSTVGPRPWAQQQPRQGSFAPQSASLPRQQPWIQNQNPRTGHDQNVVGTSHQSWSGTQQSQNHLSMLPAVTSGAQTSWNLHQSHADHDASRNTGVREQSVVIPQQAQAAANSMSQATHWSSQNLPTPAPSSISSQIPSPATSTLNAQLDQYAQPTPSYTDSPERHDSTSSASRSSQGPRAQQAELVASLFSAAAQLPAPKSASPEPVVTVIETTDDTQDEDEEFHGLDYPDPAFANSCAVQNPAKLVGQPMLASMDELDREVQTLAANSNSTNTSLSRYLQEQHKDCFLKNVQESAEWSSLKDDPIFSKIKANTTTVTFDELIARRHQLMTTSYVAGAEDHFDEVAERGQETDGERLAREQEERLAALGVTGSAKPVQMSPISSHLAGTPSPAEPTFPKRVSGDPGWKHYEHGRPVEHRSMSLESVQSTTKDTRIVSSRYERSPSELLQDIPGTVSPDTNRSKQQPHNKRAYSETSEELEGIEEMPKRQASERNQRKPRFKQPVVAAAYG